MDQATASTTMDSRKPAVRSLQLGSKAPNSSDANREVCKRSNGVARRQRDLERDGLVGGGCGGARGKAYGGPGRAASGRSSNKVIRNKEKEGKQVKSHGMVSLDHYDDDDYYESSERLRRPPQHLRGDPRPNRSSVDYGGYRDRPGGKKHKQRGGSGALYKTHTNERSFQARCQFLVNYKKEAEAVAKASMPVGFTPPPPAAVAAQPNNASSSDSVVSGCAGAGGACEEGWKEAVEAALSDPDALVSWGSVEEVLLHTTEPFSCPVCLYPPVAPQVTRCGHIYCYPCILHYLALSDKKWRGCPICNLLVVREDLKSVAFVVHPDYRVGSSIRMRLMSRLRDSLVAEPVSVPGQRRPPDTKNMFCRTMQASTEKVLAIIERERTALEVQMVTEGSEPEACFIEQALALLKDRQQNLPDFGAEVADQLSDFTLNDSPDAALKAERNSPLASNLKHARANVPAEKGIAMASNERASLAGTVSSSVPTSKAEQSNPLGVGAQDNQEMGEDRDRKSSGSSSHSSSSVAVSIPGDILSLHASSSREPLGLCSVSNDDSDDSSSISSSTSNELIFSNVTGDMLSPETGSASESSCGLSPTDISPLNFETPASIVSLDDCNVADTAAAAAAAAAPPSECLQFDLEDEMTGKVAATLHKKKQEAPKSVLYFYQACDGSHVYLQPLNLAMLAREFGGAANCPATISANIVEMEYGTMTDRALTQGNRRFLCHLPLCCCYELVELDLKTLVSPRTLDSFKSSLDCREHARAQRAKKEQLIELRNREKEEKEYSGRLFQYVKSAYTGPCSRPCEVAPAAAGGAAAEFNEENYPVMGSTSGGRSHRHSTSSDGHSSPSLATSPPLASGLPGAHNARRKQQQPPQQISFAKVLTTQTASRSVQPRPAGGDGTAASVWGRPARSADSSGAATTSRSAADDGDDEARFSAPTYSMNLDMMLTNALSASGGGGKKNKKGKKKMKSHISSTAGEC